MDVIKVKKRQSKIFGNKYLLAAAMAVLVIALLMWALQTAGSISVSRNEILIETAQQGDLEVVAQGFGFLSSNKQQLITALTRAAVKEIVPKSGVGVVAV